MTQIHPDARPETAAPASPEASPSAQAPSTPAAPESPRQTGDHTAPFWYGQTQELPRTDQDPAPATERSPWAAPTGTGAGTAAAAPVGPHPAHPTSFQPPAGPPPSFPTGNGA
jgi:putative serine protease PepD